MTNDKTVTMSLELAERLVKGDASKGANALQLVDAWKAMSELRALIAAPVVERQEPIMHITPQVLGMLKGELRMQSGGITFSESKPIGNWTVPLFTTPPAPHAVDQLLREAYEHGYVDGQNNPNGYGDKADRDKCVAGLLDGITIATAQPADLPAAKDQTLTFQYQHPFTKEIRTVTLTKADIVDGMEDGMYEKLVKQFCQCESVGETNVIDCNCDEYIHDFDLVSDDATPATAPLHQQLADVTHQRDLLVEAISGAAIKAGIVRADMEIPGPALLMLADDMADTIINLNATSAADQ